MLGISSSPCSLLDEPLRVLAAYEDADGVAEHVTGKRVVDYGVDDRNRSLTRACGPTSGKRGPSSNVRPSERGPIGCIVLPATLGDLSYAAPLCIGDVDVLDLAPAFWGWRCRR
jgi:hypothetical protein